MIALKSLIANKEYNHCGFQNARKTHTPDENIQDICGTQNQTAINLSTVLIFIFSAGWSGSRE